jgi:hypothetical protein
MKDSLSIKFRADADYSEVKDSVKDVLIAGLITEEALSDGWQWMDLLEVPKVEERISEVIEDAPIFVEQFLKLKGKVSVQAITEAANELIAEGYTFGVVTRWIINGLYVLATTYQSAEEVYLKGKTQYEMFQAFIKGDEVLQFIEA